MLIGLLLVAANLRAGISAVGPVMPQIEHDLGFSSVAASALVSLPLLAFAGVSPLAPALAVRLGLERSVGAALVALGAGLVLRSMESVALLWVGTALIGMAIAVLNVLLPSLVKRDFPQRIGQITGAYSAVQSIFAAVSAGIAVPLAGLTALGWRLPLGMWAGLALIAFAVLIPTMTARAGSAAPHPVGRASAAAPRSEGASRESASPAATARAASRSPWGSALAWQVTLFMGLQSIVYYVLVTWLPSIEIQAGIDETAAGVSQFLLNAAGILGSLACSALIARLRDQRMLGVTIPVVMFVGTAGLLIAPGGAMLWACIAGIGGGASIVLALSFFGLRTEHHRQAAALSGMAQGVGYLLAAAGPPVVGGLHDVTGSWAPALVVLMAVEAVLVVFGYLSGRARILR